jgi:hypothetical protein
MNASDRTRAQVADLDYIDQVAPQMSHRYSPSMSDLVSGPLVHRQAWS